MKNKSIERKSEYISLNNMSLHGAGIILPITVTILFIFTLLYKYGERIGAPGVYCTLILTVIVSILFMLIKIKNILDRASKEDIKKILIECTNCASDCEKLTLSEYGIVTLPEMLEVERLLSKHPNASACEVYNYTTLDETFDNPLDNYAKYEVKKVKEIIKDNLSNGVKYTIFHVKKEFAIKKENIMLYGKDSLVLAESAELYNNACFDVMLYITPEIKYGYVAVNFTSTDGNCETCNNKAICDYKNHNLIYRKLSGVATKYLYNQLSLLKPINRI